MKKKYKNMEKTARKKELEINSFRRLKLIGLDEKIFEKDGYWVMHSPPNKPGFYPIYGSLHNVQRGHGTLEVGRLQEDHIEIIYDYRIGFHLEQIEVALRLRDYLEERGIKILENEDMKNKSLEGLRKVNETSRRLLDRLDGWFLKLHNKYTTFYAKLT